MAHAQVNKAFHHLFEVQKLSFDQAPEQITVASLGAGFA